MNILYCGDKNIADGVIISTLSIAMHTNEPLDIYILTASITVNSKRFIALDSSFTSFLQKKLAAVNKNVKVILIDVTDIFHNDAPHSNLNTRFTPCCMLRLYADLVEGLPSRLLYLDNDVIARGDICELYHKDISGYELAGVPDYYGSHFFRKNPFKRDYINSGVLLLDMQKLKVCGTLKKCRRLCREKKMFMPDQSALNKAARAKMLLPRRYNEQRRLRGDTLLQHFTTSFRFFPYFHTVSVKPWQIEKMHSILKLHEYDGILEEYKKIAAEYERSDKNE